MAVATLAAFWLVSFLLVITPEADWAYAITAGLRYRSVLPAVGGLLSGHLAATLVVAAGVAGLLARSPTVMTVLTVAGALYLVWLGVSTWMDPPDPHEDNASELGSWQRQALKGAGISGLNPKVFLLFLALLPQFTDPTGSWPIATQIAALGMLHVLSCAVIYTAVGSHPVSCSGPALPPPGASPGSPARPWSRSGSCCSSSRSPAITDLDHPMGLPWHRALRVTADAGKPRARQHPGNAAVGRAAGAVDGAVGHLPRQCEHRLALGASTLR